MAWESTPTECINLGVAIYIWACQLGCGWCIGSLTITEFLQGEFHKWWGKGQQHVWEVHRFWCNALKGVSFVILILKEVETSSTLQRISTDMDSIRQLCCVDFFCYILYAIWIHIIYLVSWNDQRCVLGISRLIPYFFYFKSFKRAYHIFSGLYEWALNLEHFCPCRSVPGYLLHY